VTQNIGCTSGFSGYLALMDWQQLVSLMIVGAAGLLLLAGKLRRHKFSFQRDTHCGCAAAAQFSPQSSSSIVFRARKGERPQVVVKMR
jgi:hypothetical protein